jgi:hypothetical protein
MRSLKPGISNLKFEISDSRINTATPLHLSQALKSGIITNMRSNTGPLADFFLSPKNVGEAIEPRFVGRSASFRCGASVRISLHVDESQRITQAKFKAAGCSVLVASASLLLDQVVGKTTGDAASLGPRIET